LIFSNHLSSYPQKLTGADEQQDVDEQQENTGREVQEELEEFDISTDNIIEERDTTSINVIMIFLLSCPFLEPL
jgi:hypothetical protein